MLLLRIKFSLAILIIYLQFSAAAKKRKPTSLQKAVSTVSTFLSDVKSVFQDFVDVMSDFLGGVDDDDDDGGQKKLDWGDRITKYTEDTVSLGYKLLTDMIPVLDVARSSVDDAVPMLPNVTVSKFIQSLLNTLVPDLMAHQKKQNEQKFNYADT